MNALQEQVAETEPGRTTVKTTLYDLIAALQTAAAPEEDAVIVGAVMHLIRTGRIRFLDNISGVN